MVPFVLIAVLAVLAVIVIALPASMLKRYLPAGVNAEDFSGTVWHGSAGAITANGVNLGAVEWHLHPGALLASDAAGGSALGQGRLRGGWQGRGDPS